MVKIYAVFPIKSGSYGTSGKFKLLRPNKKISVFRVTGLKILGMVLQGSR